MNEKSIISKLINIATNQQKILQKLAQMGAGVRIHYTSPQVLIHLLQDQISDFANKIDPNISVGVYKHHLSFFDGAGTLGGDELDNKAIHICDELEKHFHLFHGELFNYSNIESA
jgi:hypothetical protein